MPYQFTYNVHGTPRFKCSLHSMQCPYYTKRGQQCKRIKYMGFEACHQHIVLKHNLRIAPSKIIGAGKGLFAATGATGATGRTIVFKNKQRIIEYKGERVNSDQLDDRYGDFTAPYALSIDGRSEIIKDSACKRGIASFVNHSDPAHANARIYAYKSKLYIRSIKPIYDGDEIVVYYGNVYMIHEHGISHSTRYTRNARGTHGKHGTRKRRLSVGREK